VIASDLVQETTATLPDNADEEERTRNEGAQLARAVFGIELSLDAARRYSDAIRVLGVGNGDGAASDANLLARAIARGADLEAIELALRLTRRQNAITHRVHILSFLIESDAKHAERFRNTDRARLRAFRSLAWHTLRGLWKFLRGRWLISRLGDEHA
jgi:hypothetical protein